LLDRRGAVASDRSGFWTLRRTGNQRFVFVPCPASRQRTQLQLTKLKLVPLVSDGLTTVPHRKGFTYAVDVNIPESGTLVVRPTDDPGQHGTDDTFFTGVLPPTGKMRNISGLEADNFFFEAGRGLYPHHTTPYYYQYRANLTAPAQAGDH